MNIEQQGKDEAESLKISWSNGPYNLLLSRTTEKYKHKATAERRRSIEVSQNVILPQITDKTLLSLYEHACEKYMRRCHRQPGGYTGFSTTPSENKFAEALNFIIGKNPTLRHLEVYPSQSRSKDLRPGFKMVVGNYVPDFVVFGLKTNGCSAVAIEIDGNAHVYKYAKDEVRSAHLKEMKIFPFEVQNDQSTDIAYLTSAILSLYRLRNGSFNRQILRSKRMIWTKTIACQLSLKEIEELVLQLEGTHLHLNLEAHEIAKTHTCPRKMRAELLGIRSRTQKP